MGRLSDKFRQKPFDASDTPVSKQKKKLPIWSGRSRKDQNRCSSPSVPSNVHQDLNGKPLSLWDQAYDVLKAKDSQLVEKYEKLLLEELTHNGP